MATSLDEGRSRGVAAGGFGVEVGGGGLLAAGVVGLAVVGAGLLLLRPHRAAATPAMTRARQTFDGTSPGVPLLIAPGDSSGQNTVTRLPFSSSVLLLDGPLSGPCPADWQAQPNCGDHNGDTYYAVQGGGYLRRYDIALA